MIDLLPFIMIRVPGYPDLRFTDGECDFDFAADEEAHDEEDDWLSSKLFQEQLAPEVTIDWEAAQIPALPPPLLERGASTARPGLRAPRDARGGRGPRSLPLDGGAARTRAGA